MPLRVPHFGLACALAAIGCGGAQTPTQPAETAASIEKAELRAIARKQRREIRELERRLLMARQSEQEAPQPGAAPREDHRGLPVEVRTPEVLSDEDELPSDYEIVGTDDEGVAIVYVGEAASEESYRPPVGRYDLSDHSGSEDDDSATASVTRARRGDLRDVPRASDRLTVMRDVPSIDEGAPAPPSAPTIDAQMRRARSAAPPRRKRPPQDPRAEYDRYYKALRAGNHAFARAGFENFVERFPEHDFADNAQYWLAEAYYDQKEFGRAAAEFEKVVDLFPRGNKVPDALLKLGFCQQRLGKKEEAVSTLQDVVRRYPKTNPAKIAAERLATQGE